MKHIKLKQLFLEIIPHGVDVRQGLDIMKRIHTDRDTENSKYFIKSYIQAALWTEQDDLNNPPEDEDDTEGEEWKEKPEKKQWEKKEYTIKDLAPETLEKMTKDCIDFYNKYNELYHSAGWSDDKAAFDFWLTRNRHGSGFFDREMEDLDQELNYKMSRATFEGIKESLIEAAHSYGEFHLYVGDDGLVYGM